MNHGILDGGGSPVEYQTRTIASGDTTINSETYTRLFRGPLDPAAAMNYVGGIRDDMTNQRRYFIDPSGVETDITINQFLEIGDTVVGAETLNLAFNVNGGGEILQENDTLFVQAIDSVLENNGNYSVTYLLGINHTGMDYPNIVYNAVRGLETFNGFEHWGSTYCYHEDGEQSVESTPWMYSCNAYLDEEMTQKLVVSPNPVSNTFSLNGPKELKSLELYNIEGKLIKVFNASLGANELSVSDLDSGMYLLSVNSGEQVLRLQKN